MYLIGKRRCPKCGVKSIVWKRNPNVFICPNCRTFFNEFGIILESEIESEDVIT